MKESIVANLEINEDVLIFNKDSEFIDEGLITRIEFDKGITRRAIEIVVNGKSYRLSGGWNPTYRIFNKARYHIASQQNAAKEMMDVAKTYAAYASGFMTVEQSLEVICKAKELINLTKAIAEANSGSMGMNPKGYQKAWGNTALTKTEIDQEFLDRSCFQSAELERTIKDLLKQNPPDNLVSIFDGKAPDNIESKSAGEQS